MQPEGALMPAAGIPLLASVAGGALGLGAVGVSALAIGASLALQVVGGKLFGRQQSGRDPRDLKRTVRSPVEPRKVAYGWARIGGPMVKVASSGEGNRDLHLVIALCQGPIDGFAAVFLNESIYQNTGGDAYVNGFATDFGFKGVVDWRAIDLKNPTPTEAAALQSAPGFLGGFPLDYSFDGQRIHDQGRNSVIRAWTGRADQPADAAAVSSLPGWTEDHRLVGIAYLYATLTFESADVWPSGIPSLSALVRGRPVYDPRKDSTMPGGSGGHRPGDPESWEWSRNPVLCALDYLRAGSPDIAYPGGVPFFVGLAAPDDELDWPQIMAAANICDEDIPAKQKLAAAYEAGGVDYQLVAVEIDPLHEINYAAVAASLDGSTPYQAAGVAVSIRYTMELPAGYSNYVLRLATAGSAGVTLDTGQVVIPFGTGNAGLTIRTGAAVRLPGETLSFTVTVRNDGAPADPWWFAWQLLGDGPDSPGFLVLDSRENSAVINPRNVQPTPETGSTVAVSDASWFAFQQDNAAAVTLAGTMPYNRLTGDVWIEVEFEAPVTGTYFLRAVARSSGYVVIDGADAYPAQSWTVNPPAAVSVELAAGPHRIAFVYARNEAGGTDFETNPSYIAATLRDSTDSTTIVSSRTPADAVYSTGTVRRYTLDGVVSLDRPPLEVLEDMASAMAGRIVYAQGKWRFYPAAASLPVAALDEDDLRGPLRLRPRNSLAEGYNGVRGTYAEPAALYEETEFPGLSREPDPTLQTWREISLPFTLRDHRAQRIAAIVLRRADYPLELVFPAKLSGLPVLPGECVTVSLQRFGWEDKKFLVESWEFAEDGGVDLVLIEEDDSIYDYSILAEKLSGVGAGTRAPLPGSAGQGVGDPVNNGDPVNLGYANQTYVRRAGDSMTGPLVLPADPAEPLQAATKQYVDASGGVSLGLVIGVS